MATHKKPTSDSKDKAAAKKPRGVTFDVVPPGKVMPSATARPVITSIEPQQPDNTLTQPGSAPLIHKPITLQPTGKAEAASSVSQEQGAEKAAADLGAALDDLEHKAPSAPEVPAVLGDDKPAKSEGAAEKPAGRSVADLLSAKQTAVAPPESEQAEATAPEAAEAKPASKAGTHGLTIQPLSGDDKSPEAQPAKPESDGGPDKQAEAEPAEAADAPAANEVDGDSKAEAQQAADSGAELADLNTKGKEKLADEPLPPPELYGGKPVIEIHEAHPVRSAIKAILMFLLMLGLALLIFNFLLDAGVVSLGVDIPHTDLLEP